MYKWFLLLILGCALMCQGCETARGFKKDMGNLWQGVKSQDSKIHKADAWIKEHMW